MTLVISQSHHLTNYIPASAMGFRWFFPQMLPALMTSSSFNITGIYLDLQFGTMDHILLFLLGHIYIYIRIYYHSSVMSMGFSGTPKNGTPFP